MAGRQVPRLRREMGAVFQDFRLLPNKTVHENVAYALQVIGKPGHVIRQLVPETLEMVGLDGKEKRFPHQLSGGEQQRVAIARAVVNRPQILLCDEPTGNLDRAISLDIVRLLDRINRTGTTIVMATHDHDIVNDLRRRVIQLERRLGRARRAGRHLQPRRGGLSRAGTLPVLRGRLRPAPQRVDGGLGRPRHDGLDVPARARACSPSARPTR